MNHLDRFIQRWRFSVAAANIPQGSRVLDIGAHNGDFLSYMGSRIGPSVGVDPETDQDSSVKSHQLLAGYFPARMPQGQFDAASLLAVVEHLDDAALVGVGEALTRVVRPLGRVIVTMPSPAADGLLNAMQRAGLIHGMDLEAHRQLSVNDLIRAWTKCGLVCKRKRRFELGLNNLVVFEVNPREATHSDRGVG